MAVKGLVKQERANRQVRYVLAVSVPHSSSLQSISVLGEPESGDPPEGKLAPSISVSDAENMLKPSGTSK